MLLLLAACKLDAGLNKVDDDPVPFDSGTTDGTETTTDSVTTPTDDTGPPPTCADQSFSGATVPVDEACGSPPTKGTFTPVIEWANTTVGDSYAAPVVGQLNDDDGDGAIDSDDLPDIVVFANSSTVFAVSGDGSILWTAAMPAGGAGTAAIGDLDNDGFPEVVAASTTIYAFHGEDGSRFWDGPGDSSAICGAVSIGDLDADGDPEVIMGRIVLDGQDGSLRGTGAYGTGSGYPGGGGVAAASAVADVDRDGVQEVVVGNALYDADGATLWSNGLPDGYPAVADFDGDAAGEIVVTWSGNVRLQDDDGTAIWSANYLGDTSGPPTVADFDGDGEPEIGVAGRSLYMVIDGDGSVLWSRPITDNTSGFTGSSVFDFEGDGVAEVVYADEQDVWVFAGDDGTVKLRESTHSSLTCSEYPTVADVDNDGHAEIVYTSNVAFGSETGLRVIGDADDSWMPGRQVWNQYAYNITNVEEDGAIPAVPDVNWDTYNNFRSGDVSRGKGAPLADLGVVLHDVCELECAEGRVLVWYALENGGTAAITDPVEVEFVGETDAGTVVLGSATWSAGVASGERTGSTEIELLVSGTVYALRARVVTDADQCDTTDDEAVWADVVCG